MKRKRGPRKWKLLESKLGPARERLKMIKKIKTPGSSHPPILRIRTLGLRSPKTEIQVQRSPPLSVGLRVNKSQTGIAETYRKKFKKS